MTFVGIMTKLSRVANDHVEVSHPRALVVNERENIVERVITLSDNVRIQLFDKPNITQTTLYLIFETCMGIVTNIKKTSLIFS